MGTTEPHPSQEPFRKYFLVGLTVGITLLFLVMIRQFLLSVLMAAIFSGMAHPIYRAFLRRMNGRRPWASVTTIAVILVVVGLPLVALLGLVASQAVEVTQARARGSRGRSARWADWTGASGFPFLDGLPGIRSLVPTGEEIVAKVGEVASTVGSFLVGSLGATDPGHAGVLPPVLHHALRDVLLPVGRPCRSWIASSSTCRWRRRTRSGCWRGSYP